MSDFSTFFGATADKMPQKGGVVALGNFDGVHLGHRSVLRTASVRARKDKLHVAALTFDPHPCVFFQKEKEPFMLTPTKAKLAHLHEADVDEVVVLPFTAELAALTPEAFVRHVLIEGLAPRHVVVGVDFVFGAKRAGNQAMLCDLLAPHDINVIEVPLWHDTKGKIVSSTRIREALWRGDPLLTRYLMGRVFAIEGTVIHGEKRGRKIGFPTANIELGDYIRPKFGVYAGKVRRSGDDKEWTAVINIGNRPTVDGTEELLEAHILDFDRDIYGQTWHVELWAFLRPEQKFSGLHALKDQIAKDTAEAYRFAGL